VRELTVEEEAVAAEVAAKRECDDLQRRRAEQIEKLQLDARVESVELLGADVDPIPLERVPFAVTTLQGPDGRTYLRTKWVDESGSLAAPYVVVHVNFASGRQVVLEDDLNCDGGGTMLEDLPPSQNALWRQLGDAEDDLALQLFLKRRKPSPEAKSYLVNSFTVPVVYVSTPLQDFENHPSLPRLLRDDEPASSSSSSSSAAADDTKEEPGGRGGLASSE